jgi:hypothetical protein
MSRKKLDVLKEEANKLDESPAKVALLEEAIRIADSLGDVDEGLKLRDSLLFAAYKAGQEEKAFVAFAWSSAHRRDALSFMDEYLLLFQYKLLLGLAPDFHSVSLESIRKMQEDFKLRLTSGVYSLRVYYRAMTSNARDMGFLEEEAAYRKLWRESRPDTLFACEACECWYRVDACLSDGEFSRARAIARPVLAGKLNSCNVPTHTNAAFLRTLLLRGDVKNSEKFFKEGFPLANGNEDALWSLRWYLAFMIRTGDIASGLRLIERHLPMAMRRTNAWQRMQFLSLIGTFFERLHEVRAQTRKVRLPESLGVYRPESRYTPFELSQWFRKEADRLAMLFDHRNGNKYQSWELARDRAACLGLPITPYSPIPTAVEAL